jgi:hypothetical protein
MKRIALATIGIGVVVAIAAGQACAGERIKGCSLATLDGQFLFDGTATLFPPAFGVKKQSIATSGGFHIFNGDGTGTDFVTFVVNGVNQNVASPVATAYTLKADCTGTLSITNGPHFNIYVAIDGSGFTEVATDPGSAYSEVVRRSVKFGKTAP